jgi:MFS family permease
VAIWMLGLPLGLGLANGAGGWILQNWGWRNAFYIAAVPGILCAVRRVEHDEPPRGTLEQHAVGARRRPGNPYMLVLSIPTMLWIICRGRCTTSTCTRSGVRLAVPRALSSNELRQRRLGGRVRLRLLGDRRA